MAAAALLRSVARKLARAPPPHPLARGLRDGARSGPASLPPRTSDQMIQLGMAYQLAVGMDAAAALRSGGLPSLARKIARAPPQGYHHRLLYKRGLHSSTSPNPGASGSTPPPTSDKDLIENLPIRLSFAGAFGTVAVYLYFWDESLIHAIEKLESVIDEHEGNMQSPGHGETRVDKSEVDQVLKAFPVMKEIADDIKDIQATSEAIQVIIKENRAAAAELRATLESAFSERELKELLSAEKNEIMNHNMLELLLPSLLHWSRLFPKENEKE